MRNASLLTIICLLVAALSCTGVDSADEEVVGEQAANLLPLRERVAITEGWWQWRKANVLPMIMREQGVDLWIIRDDEADKYYNNEGPVFSSLVPADLRGMIYDSQHGDARPRFLIFHDAGESIEYIEPLTMPTSPKWLPI